MDSAGAESGEQPPSSSEAADENAAGDELTFETLPPAVSLALASLGLVLFPADWIYRRKETLQFLDERRIQRQVSVDLLIPDDSQLNAPGDQRSVVLPVSLLAKSPLKRFDVRDESGRALPALTRKENSEVAEALLRMLAIDALEGEFGPDVTMDQWVWRDIAAIGTDDYASALAALGRIARAEGLGSGDQRTALWKDQAFQTLAIDLAQQFILFVHVEAYAGQRRIIKFCEEQALEPWDLQRSERYGLLPVAFSILAPAVGDAQSYHAEMLTPGDLNIDRIELQELEDSSGALRSVRTLSAETNTAVGHVLTQDQDRGTVAQITVQLRLRPEGLVFGSLVVSAATAALLSLGVLLRTAFDVHLTSAEAGPALLVALPGVYAILLARPDEHQMTQRLVSGFKRMVLVSAATSFGAATTLVVSFSSTARLIFWIVLAAITLVITGVLAVAWLRARGAQNEDPTRI